MFILGKWEEEEAHKNQKKEKYKDQDLHKIKYKNSDKHLTSSILKQQVKLIQGISTNYLRELKSAMQSLGFESKNPTIFNMIADL